MLLNDVVHYVSSFFTKKIGFVELSQRIATHLYASTHHPNIAVGDLFVVLFDKVRSDEKYRSAIGIYKSESKQHYISAKTEGGVSQLEELIGINPELIDKGALIIEGSDSVYALDRFNNRTKYWLEDFLKVRQVPDEKTKSAIAVGLVDKIRETIDSPSAQYEFGQKVIALCSEKDEIFGSELKQLSERYVSGDVWDRELERVAKQKGLIEIGDMGIPVKKFENKLKKTLNHVNLGRDIVLTIPSNLSFEGVEFAVNGKTIRIDVELEEKNG